MFCLIQSQPRRVHPFCLVRLSLLTTMTNPNQLCDVWLFVCSKMADETSLSSNLPVADRTREVWGRKLYWWCLSSGFPLCTFLLGFADSFCFVFTSSPFYEASPLCTILWNLFSWLCWYVEVFKGGFEGVLVSLLLTTMGAFSYFIINVHNSRQSVSKVDELVYHLQSLTHLVMLNWNCTSSLCFHNFISFRITGPILVTLKSLYRLSPC